MVNVRPIVPRSGPILGAAVRALKLETPKKSAKNFQRYFAGERLRAETVAELHRAVAEVISDDADVCSPAIREPVAAILFAAIQATAERWDDTAALIETLPPADSLASFDEVIALAAPVFLCLSAVDLALRFGALHQLLGTLPTTGRETWAWAEDDHGGILLRRWLRDAQITRDELTEATRLGENTIDAWLDGRHRPEGENLATLARILEPRLGRPRDELRRRLVRHFALAKLAEHVALIAGRPYLGEAAFFFSHLTEFVHSFLAQSKLEAAERRAALLGMVCNGARYERSVWVVNSMRRNFNDRFWWSVFTASTKDWVRWLQNALTQGAAVIGAARLGFLSSTGIEQLRDQLRFDLSDIMTPPDGKSQAEWLRELSDKPEHTVVIFSSQAERLMAFGEFAEAAACLRHVVRLAPENPHFHHRLGCALWMAVLEDPAISLDRGQAWLSDAEQSLWTALQIAAVEGPKWNVPYVWDVPLVELGWIKLEFGRNEDGLAHAQDIIRRLDRLTDRAAFYIAQARLQNSDVAGAMQMFLECLRLNPRHQLAKEGIQKCRDRIKEQRAQKSIRR